MGDPVNTRVALSLAVTDKCGQFFSQGREGAAGEGGEGEARARGEARQDAGRGGRWRRRICVLAGQGAGADDDRPHPADANDGPLNQPMAHTSLHPPNDNAEQTAKARVKRKSVTLTNFNRGAL